MQGIGECSPARRVRRGPGLRWRRGATRGANAVGPCHLIASHGKRHARRARRRPRACRLEIGNWARLICFSVCCAPRAGRTCGVEQCRALLGRRRCDCARAGTWWRLRRLLRRCQRVPVRQRRRRVPPSRSKHSSSVGRQRSTQRRLAHSRRRRCRSRSRQQPPRFAPVAALQLQLRFHAGGCCCSAPRWRARGFQLALRRLGRAAQQVQPRAPHVQRRAQLRSAGAGRCSAGRGRRSRSRNLLQACGGCCCCIWRPRVQLRVQEQQAEAQRCGGLQGLGGAEQRGGQGGCSAAAARLPQHHRRVQRRQRGVPLAGQRARGRGGLGRRRRGASASTAGCYARFCCTRLSFPFARGRCCGALAALAAQPVQLRRGQASQLLALRLERESARVAGQGRSKQPQATQAADIEQRRGPGDTLGDCCALALRSPRAQALRAP